LVEPRKAPRNATPTAGPFERVRQDHAQEMAEDYAEMILELEEADRTIRPADLARRLGVTHVTVLRALDRLARNGILVRDERLGIRLSLAGRALGAACRSRHQLVVAFLERLGVPPEVAAVDGEGMEHHISPVTLDCMAAWLGPLTPPVPGRSAGPSQ